MAALSAADVQTVLEFSRWVDSVASLGAFRQRVAYKLRAALCCELVRYEERGPAGETR